MSNMVLLVVCFILGIVLRRTGRLPEATPKVLNTYIINVALPALALLHIHDLEFRAALAYPAAMAWVLFVGSLLFLLPMKKIAGLSTGTLGALLLTAGLGNTSFVGLPMIEAFYGAEYLGIGILADQLGSFLVLSTVGIAAAAACSSGRTSLDEITRKVLIFPPFVAMVAGFVLMAAPFPGWFEEVLGRIGGTLSPLALISVGCQLRLGHIREHFWPLGLGLLYKLVLGPALVAFLFVVVMGARGTEIQVTLFEAAMAPMITGGIVAAEYNLDGDLAALMVGLGIPLSFLTLPIWFQLLSAI
jgi:hypothetical protein